MITHKEYVERLQSLFNSLLSKYYCNCDEGRHGEVGRDVRESIKAITDLMVEVVGMEYAPNDLGMFGEGCDSAKDEILKTIRGEK